MIREVTKALVKAGRGAVAISRSLGTSFKKFVLRKKGNALCEEIYRGIYRCGNGYDSKLVALYTIEDADIRIDELEYLDLLSHLKRYINTVTPPGCRLITLSKIELVNIDKYLTTVDSKLQMKIVEIEQDKANTRIRASIEKLLEVRRRVLSGIIPIEISNTIAIVCKDLGVYRESMTKIPKLAKQILNISLKSVRSLDTVTQIINFR
jgi:hypothetical protein